MISIILPVYNGARYLSKSIDSVINQTYSDWELIIVDDCSSDSTPEIIKKYCDADKRIKSVRNDVNLRLPASLNRGFFIAAGDFFTWTSDDNIYHPDALKKMHEALIYDESIGLVYADMNFIDDAGNFLSSSIKNCHDIRLCNCVGACFMYRKEVADTIGQYNEDRFLVEDYDYWIRIFSKYKIKYISEVLYDYRFHRNSLTSTRTLEIDKMVAGLKLDYLDVLTTDMNTDEKNVFNLSVIFNDISLMEKMVSLGTISSETAITLKKMCRIDDKRQYIIVGAGRIGEQAFEYIGAERVFCFADNYNSTPYVKGKKCIKVADIKALNDKYAIMIAAGYMNALEIVSQLIEYGITDFSVFSLVKQRKNCRFEGYV